jgi:adenylate cyclase class 1
VFDFRHLAGAAKRDFAIEPVSYNPDLGRQYLQIKVLVESGDDFSHQYTVICDGREFSSLAHGSDLFRVVARHVMSLRHNGPAYPIYITDIDLCGVQTPGESDQTVRLLEHKKLIEERLNRALNALSATG